MFANSKNYMNSGLHDLLRDLSPDVSCPSSQRVPSQHGHFFESPSKYISLKQHKQQNDCYCQPSHNIQHIS